MSTVVQDANASRADRLIDRAARIGFIAKGLVAMVIGGVALRLAVGDGAALIGPEGALRTFVGQPMGRTLLGFMAAGLWAHAAWKLVQAFLDPERKGRGVAAIAERVAFGGAALGYAALGLVAARLTLGQSLEPSGGADELAAKVLTPRLGRVLVGAAG